MITFIEVSDTELNRLKKTQIFSCDMAPSYSEIWRTPEGFVLKHFLGRSDGDFKAISRDIATLNSIVEFQHVLDNRFVLPFTILKKKGSVIGYIMPFIQGERLGCALGHTDQITAAALFTTIYRDIILLHKQTRSISISDLHEDNIILDEKNCLCHIDVDGWYNSDGKGRNSRYLTMSSPRLHGLSAKYKTDESGMFLANINTDLFCLVIMLLNYVMNSKISFAELPFNFAAEYLNFLSINGAPRNFITMVETLYTTEDNFFDENVVKYILEEKELFSYSNFLLQTSQFSNNQSALEYLQSKERQLNRMFKSRNKDR